MAAPTPIMRSELEYVLNHAVQMGKISASQRDQALAQFDQYPATRISKASAYQQWAPDLITGNYGGIVSTQPGAPAPTGSDVAQGTAMPRAGTTTTTAGGGLPNEQMLPGSGMGATDVFPLNPEEATGQWLQGAFGGVNPDYQKAIADLAGQKWWDWLLTRHRLGPELMPTTPGSAPGMWQDFLQRENAAGGLAIGQGRQAGAQDLQWLIDLVSSPTGPANASDPIANQLWADLQTQGGVAPVNRIQDILQGVAGSGVDPWFSKGLQAVMNNRLQQYTQAQPRASSADILRQAQGWGLPFYTPY